MGASVSFDNLKRGWVWNRGKFDLIFTIALGQFADLSRLPEAMSILGPICADTLSDAWPERFAFEDEGAPPYFTFTDLPHPERVELCRCVQAAADALQEGAVDKRVPMNWDNRLAIAATAHDLAELMEMSLAIEAAID